MQKVQGSAACTRAQDRHSKLPGLTSDVLHGWRRDWLPIVSSQKIMRPTAPNVILVTFAALIVPTAKYCGVSAKQSLEWTGLFRRVSADECILLSGI